MHLAVPIWAGGVLRAPCVHENKRVSVNAAHRGGLIQSPGGTRPSFSKRDSSFVSETLTSSAEQSNPLPYGQDTDRGPFRGPPRTAPIYFCLSLPSCPVLPSPLFLIFLLPLSFSFFESRINETNEQKSRKLDVGRKTNLA